MRSTSRILAAGLLAALAAGCAASGKAVIEQYQDVTPTRFEGAVAAVLKSDTTARMDDAGKVLTLEEFTRVKLLDRKATDCSGNSRTCRIERAVCYLEGLLELVSLEARTIKPDGQIIEIEKDDMQDVSNPSPLFPEQTLRCVTWQAKGAGPGAILEERAVMRSEKLYMFPGTKFQTLEDPVLETNYTLDAPADYRYRWKVYNLDIQPTEKKAGNRIIRTWQAVQVPPLRPEPGMVAVEQVIAKLVIAPYELPVLGKVETWEDMGNAWYGLIEDKLKATDAIKQVAARIAKNATSEAEKLRVLWDYMNESIRYVARGKGLGGIVPLSSHVVCTKKYGDCKAVSGLIHVLARELGLKADPVLIGPRPDFGERDVELPAWAWPHAIARAEADGKVYWLDATTRSFAMESIPFPNQGVSVLVARKDGSFIDEVPVEPPEANRVDFKAVFLPQKNGDVLLEASGSASGNYGGVLRATAMQMSPKQWDMAVGRMVTNAYPQAKITGKKEGDKQNNRVPYTLAYEARIPGAIQPAGRGVTFNVKQLFTFMENFDLFSKPKRRYAIDLQFRKMRTARFEVKIPDGLEVAGLPKNVMHEDEFVKLERLTQIENDRVVTVYTYKCKVLQVPPDKYQAARASFMKAKAAGDFVLMFEPPKKKS